MIIKDKTGLNFELNKEDFTAKVIKSPSANGDVFIPSFINHESQKYIIKIIGDGSFKNNNIRSINFPEDSHVNSIETDAFYGSSIQQLHIPPNLEYLNEGWCRYTLKLNKIIVSPNNKRFLLFKDQMLFGKSYLNSNDFDILYYASRNIRTAFVPSSIKYISSNAFENFINLATINFASNSKLETIGKLSFVNTSIEQISIPDQVKIIQQRAFSNCFKLRAVDISKDSQLLFIEEDAFFNTKIERIFIPSKLEMLREGWCHNTKYLIDISISEEIDRFSLFDTKMIVYKSKLINEDFDVLCFASRSIVSAFIPSTIKYIHPFAFSNSEIQTIEFSEDSEIEVIGEETFSNSKITEVLFPKSVKIIGKGTFLNCDFLSKIEFPENSELRTIESKAFFNSSIQSLNIPSKFVEFVGSWCGYTPSLYDISISPKNRRFRLLDEKIVIGKSETNDDDFDSIIFACRDIDEAVIPSNIKFINQHAFNNCKNLEKVEINRNSKLEIIEYDAFSHSSLKNIYIPRHVMRIGKLAFGSSSLENISFSRKSQLQYIAKLAFAHSFIKSISIPDTVTTINDGAFQKCLSLQSICFSDESELSIIGKNAFEQTSISKIKIPKNIKSISEETFKNCFNLECIEIPENSELKCICKNAFSTKLKSLFIPSNVKILKDGWCNFTSELNSISVSPLNRYFRDIDGKMIVGKSNTKSDNYDSLYFAARNIDKVVIPSFIKHIKSYCFHKCYELLELEFGENSQLETIEEKAFSSTFRTNNDKISKLIKPHILNYGNKSSFTQNRTNNLFIPPEITDIDELIYINSNKDINFIVSPNNKYFKDIDGEILVGKSDFYKEEYDILHFVTSNAIEITIPSSIKIIRPYASYNCNFLRTIEFEQGSKLEIIGKYSFSNTSITSISIPVHVKIIEENAFQNCPELKTVEFSSNSELKFIAAGAFSYSNISQITIPKSVECIYESAFKRCLNLVQVEFEEGSQLECIRSNAFSLTKINELNLPPLLKELNIGWFFGLISISPENKNFKLLDEKLIVGKSNLYNDHYDIIYFASRNIETAFIPSYIKRINSHAFSKCKLLKKIEFEENSELEIIDEYAFTETSITEINIPKSVKIIKNSAFQSSLIQKIIIPSQITCICEKTFYKSQLSQVEFECNSKLISIGYSAFDSTKIKSVMIPSNVQIIENSAFKNCEQLEKISFEKNSKLRSIGSISFQCTAIKSISIPDNVEDFDFWVDLNSNLKSIEFSDNSKLNQIRHYVAFLESFKIPPKVKYINENIFQRAYNLRSITVSPYNKYLKSIDGKMLIGKSNKNNEEYDILYFVTWDTVNVLIPSSIKIIQPYAFYENNQLQTVEFESGSKLENIGKYSFSKSTIMEISIPDHVKIIDEDAFDDCQNLENITFSSKSELKIIGKYSLAHLPINRITIPGSVEHIYERAFSDCPFLETVEILEESKLKSIEPFAFSNTPIRSLHIPSNVENLEKGWCRFTKKLEEVTVSKNNKKYIDIQGQYVLSKSNQSNDDFDVLCFASRSIDESIIVINSNIKKKSIHMHFLIVVIFEQFDF